MTKEFKEKVQAFQLKVYEFYKNEFDNADFENKRFAKDMLYAQKTLLNKTHYKKPKSERISTPPPKNPFQKKDFKAEEVQEVTEIVNKDVPVDAFQKKEFNPDNVVEEQPIKNENVNKNAFVKKQIFTLKEKGNPQRLSTEQKELILKLGAKGETIKAISDITMIVESKIESTLKKARKPKQNRNLIATSHKKASEKFEQEVKESRNEE